MEEKVAIYLSLVFSFLIWMIEIVRDRRRGGDVQHIPSTQPRTVQLALFMSVDLLDILRYILSFMSCHIVYRDRYHHIDRCPFHPYLSK